jgi:hypothetical protein
MIYEIINPSDALTCKADNFLVAAAAIALFGDGQYGLKEVGGNNSTPVLFGWDNWFKDNGIDDVSEFIDNNLKEVADILDSVMLGSPDDRLDLDTMLETLSGDRKKEWIAARNDRRRSSLNDIETYAHKNANRLRSYFKEKENKK